ncbi:MAG: hypothetical protein HQ541_06430 [Mariniphaga sp.]|nr:hypothetical protein [Mariniphaga sp.]
MRTKVLILATLIFASITLYAQDNQPDFKEPINILVFSKTSGYRHESISQD